MKIDVYCEALSTYPVINATTELEICPVIGDMIHAPDIAPDAGPGASIHYFKVVGRMVKHKRVTLFVERVEDPFDG